MVKVRYFLDSDRHYVAVTDETPRGPLKGFVFVGRRLVGDTVSEEAFGVDQIAKWQKLETGEVPPRCLELLGYDEAPAAPVPEPQVEPEAGSISEGGQIDHQPKPDAEARYEWAALGACLYVVAVYFFWWVHHG